MGEKKRRAMATGFGGQAVSGDAPNQPASPPAILVRPCYDQDVDQCRVIYHHHVMTGTGTFDIDPPDPQAFHAKWSKISANGWPFLVACAPHQFSRVLGFAYAQPFRERRAYAQTFEDSIYIAPFMQGRGIGRVLLQSLIDDLAMIDVRQVIAVIGDADNAGSIALHEQAGFWQAGRLHAVGHKFGRWLDVVLMQRQIDAPHTTKA